MEPSWTSTEFGKTADGRTITSYTLKGVGGAELEVLDYGGKIRRLAVPDRAGVCENVAVSLDFSKPGFGGSLIGRYANRIGEGRFTIDGVAYQLPTNGQGGGVPLTLHGGADGFHDKIWAVTPFVNGTDVGLTLNYTSPESEGGFPGTLSVKVVYTLTAENTWRIDWTATTNKATPVNFTHHVYFNLSGEKRLPVSDEILTLFAKAYTPVGPTMVPTGEIRPVAGTEFDFTAPQAIGARFNGMYDHNFCLDTSNELKPAATVEDPATGRRLEALTTEPGIQVYAGGAFTEALKDQFGRALFPFAGLALETQGWPDSVNRPEFPNTILRPGETFHSTTEYRFSVFE